MNEIPASRTKPRRISKMVLISIAFALVGLLAQGISKGIQGSFELHGIAYTKTSLFFPSLFCWTVGLFLGMSAAILVRRNKHRLKGFYPGVASGIVCGGMILYFFISSVPALPNTYVVDREMTFEGPSAKLTDTVVVPTLDTAMPLHNNVIWCSSFQFAWNELKDGIVKEPIHLASNQQVADLLNKAQQSKDDVSRDDCYARAGFVRDNIIGTIQSEMAQQFPGEPVPAFDDITDDTAIIAYSFLTANVRFAIPYFENDKPLVFNDSRNQSTAITSFGIRKEDDYAYFKMRKQIKVLFFNHGSDFKLTEFALDLCKNSSPNQIILAVVEPKSTLMQTLSYVANKEKEHPKDKYFRRFGPNDSLLVPNIFFKITHTFAKLEGVKLTNIGYEDLFFEKAMQVIQFRLDRSGAELESQAKIAVSPIPKHFLYNRPFLIYMTKRGAKHPFFAMWVDNAELLERPSVDMSELKVQ